MESTFKSIIDNFTKSHVHELIDNETDILEELIDYMKNHDLSLDEVDKLKEKLAKHYDL